LAACSLSIRIDVVNSRARYFVSFGPLLTFAFSELG
jgi:hypothetical protein